MKHVTEVMDTSQHTPRIDAALTVAVAWLWAQLSELYRERWVKRHGDKVDPNGMWARGLVGMTRDHIMQAFQLWLEAGSEHPPSVPAQLRKPWEERRRESRPRLGSEQTDPLPIADESPKGRAWRACQRIYGMRIMGDALTPPLPPGAEITMDVRTIAYSIPLCTGGDLDENKRAFARLKREFERVWLEQPA